MTIPRTVKSAIVHELTHGKKGILIYGPRQVGKTTLVNGILGELGRKSLILNADERGSWWESLVSRDLQKLKLLLEGYDLVFIDEAQRIPEIGLILKIILDRLSVKVIVTGSSSLNLASRVSEPLTGRVYTYKLFPVAQMELAATQTRLELESHLEERLVFGSYPEIFSLEGSDAKARYLANLVNAYLYKDLLEFGGIRNSSKVLDLLKLIAFQTGSQVSLTELAGSLEVSRKTVERYIDLLEKSFVIFRLTGFSRNLRKEVAKMDKIYFYDTGVRNTIIGNLNLLANRDDSGKLWENYLIIERMKYKNYTGSLASHYFWRLTSGAELDLVEDEAGKVHGFEFKFSEKTVKPPASWQETYSGSTYSCVNKSSWQDFVMS